MNICDNLAVGRIGYVRDERGGFFEISRERRSARRVDEVKAQNLKAVFETTWIDSQPVPL